MLATGGEDCTAQLRCARSGALLHTLSHSGDVTGVAFSPDGAWLLARSPSYDQTVELWKLR